MTGWRLGWSVMPAHLASRVELLMVHSVGCTASFVQEAGIAALNGPLDDIDNMREEYRRRRDLVVSGLSSMSGVSCEIPDGAFYAWADVSSFGLSSKKIAEMLLNVGFVAVLPGTDFGPGGEGFIRISYGKCLLWCRFVCDHDLRKQFIMFYFITLYRYFTLYLFSCVYMLGFYSESCMPQSDKSFCYDLVSDIGFGD